MPPGSLHIMCFLRPVPASLGLNSMLTSALESKIHVFHSTSRQTLLLGLNDAALHSCADEKVQFRDSGPPAKGLA